VATVEATARAGGLFIPAFAPRLASPEYFVLIDRRGQDDHAAHILHRWIEQLRSRSVAAEIYEFNADPRVSNEYGTTNRWRLPKLLARHHRATLLLCAESETCFDPLTNRLQPWLEAFNALPNRALLVFKPRYCWGRREALLLDAGFVVLPASPAGMQDASTMGSAWRQPRATAPKYAREFPQLIAQSELRWLNRNFPPADVVRRLLRELQSFLGPDGYTWLCTCAVYPQISWPITLTLLDPENDIAMHRALEEQLPSLARLPWFRYGFMPDWLRRFLIAHLSRDREQAVREILSKLVCGLLQPKTKSPLVDLTDESGQDVAELRLRAIDIAQAAPPNSPLRDAVFIDFIAGATSDPLALRLTSLPQTVAPRRRGIFERIRGAWRGLAVRRPLLTHGAMAVGVSVITATLALVGFRGTHMPATIADSDETYLLQADDIGGTRFAISRNGKLLVSDRPGLNGAVIWDVEARKAVSLLQTDSPVQRFTIGPRSDRIAALCSSGSVYIWDASGISLRYFPSLVTDSQSPTPMTFDASEQRLAIAGAGSLRLITLNTNTRTWDLSATRQRGPSQALAFNSSGTLLAAAPASGPISLLNATTLASAQLLNNSDSSRRFRRALAFRPDDDLLAEINDSFVDLWDLKSPSRPLSAMINPNGTLQAFAWSPGGHLLALAAPLQIRNLRAANILYRADRTLTNPPGGNLFTVRFRRSAQRPDFTTYTVARIGVQIGPPSQPPQAALPPNAQAPAAQTPAAAGQPSAPSSQNTNQPGSLAPGRRNQRSSTKSSKPIPPTNVATGPSEPPRSPPSESAVQPRSSNANVPTAPTNLNLSSPEQETAAPQEPNTAGNSSAAQTNPQSRNDEFQLEKSRFTLPADAQSYADFPDGFCCGGFSATVRTMQGQDVGYIHLAYDTSKSSSDSSSTRRVEVTVSGRRSDQSRSSSLPNRNTYVLAKGTQSEFELQTVAFQARESASRSREVRAGVLSFAITLQNAQLTQLPNDTPRFLVEGLSIVVDVSPAIRASAK
jgi:WD40 repeat protein